MEPKKIKCLVWDLDNTVWDGTLLEGGTRFLRDGVKETIEELDRRGILMSIASKNEYDDAMAELKKFGIDDYFLVPQIGWGNKSDSVAEIAAQLNLGLDTFAFIDDQGYELAEVTFAHPEVRVYDAVRCGELTSLPEFTPRFITEDSAMRRKMYKDDISRKTLERDFTGSSNEFLKSLGMKLTLSPVVKGDLERVEELTQRTNQLNSTGITYDYNELSALIGSPKHIFLIAQMEDEFGDYGKIGILLCEITEKALIIRLLLMSCRVMTRGIGSAMLIYAVKLARNRGLELQADFISTERNRIMYITYKLMGFEEVACHGDCARLVYKGEDTEYPDYLDIEIRDEVPDFTI